MTLTIRTFLLPLILLGSYLLGQAQTAKIESHGWKLVYVAYKEEPAYEKGQKEYGEPLVAFFVKDYPYQVGKEYPRLLSMDLKEDMTVDSNAIGPKLRKTLHEFDCNRHLNRIIRWFWTDGREEDKRKLIDLTTWSEVLPDTPMEAIYKYACRIMTPSKK
jgi:hypothetical protein